MWRRVRVAGIDISPKAMLAELSQIKLVDLIYAPAGGTGRPAGRTGSMWLCVTDYTDRTVLRGRLSVL